MALDAVIDIECIFALGMAYAAGLAVFHVSHGRFGCADPVREYLGVAVFALVRLQVEFVTEGGLAGRFWNIVSERTRLHAFVAFGAVAGRGKDIFAVVA